MRRKIQKILIALIICTSSIFSVLSQEVNQIKYLRWDRNTLEIYTTQKINYTESRQEDPESLTVDLNNCRIPNKRAGYEKKLKSNFDESVVISQAEENLTKIKFIGQASINRKIYLTDNERAIIIKIARISLEEETAKEIDEETNLEKYTPGYIKEITVEGNDEETEVIISATKSIKYNFYTLKNPERFVADLLNIIPPGKTLPQYKSTPLVSGIRLGPAASGLNATRVVIDLTSQNIENDISTSLVGNKLKIKFKITKTKEEITKKSNIKIVIDPGHGGYDTGASYSGFEEKNINLLISEKLKNILEGSGITVFLTRDDDGFLSLAERIDITNSIKPNVFISIHANALKTSRQIRGLETYYWSPQSQKLAYHIHSNILKNIKIPDHYLRKAKFYVIRHTSSPAILCELGFLSNHEDRKLLTSSITQDEFAKALAKGILKFLDIEPQKELKAQGSEQKKE